MHTSHLVKVFPVFTVLFHFIMDIWNRIRDFSGDDVPFYISA